MLELNLVGHAACDVPEQLCGWPSSTGSSSCGGGTSTGYFTRWTGADFNSREPMAVGVYGPAGRRLTRVTLGSFLARAHLGEPPCGLDAVKALVLGNGRATG